MPVSIIPFNMPEPAEIPSHIIDSLKSMPRDEAVAKGMDLLMQIEAADTMVYERISEGGVPELAHVAGAGAEQLQAVLEQDTARSFAGQEGVGPSALLIMGQAEVSEESAVWNWAINDGRLSSRFTGAHDKSPITATGWVAHKKAPLLPMAKRGRDFYRGVA